MSEFRVEVQINQKGVVAALAGSATNDQAQVVRGALASLLEQRASRVVLDLSDLAFIASLVLGELLEFRQGLRETGGDLRLAGPTPYVEDVFRTTRLVELFPMFHSAEEALAAGEGE